MIPSEDNAPPVRRTLFRPEAVSKYERPLVSTTPALLPVSHRGLVVISTLIALTALAVWWNN